MSWYQCAYFRPEELVSADTLVALNANGLFKEYAYRLFDSRLLRLIDYMRQEYGPMTINDWVYGGERTESGLRVPGMEDYKPFSQHTFGRAIDSILSEVSAAEVREDFSNGYHDCFLVEENIQVTFETNVSWLHVDTRNNLAPVNFFDPR